MPYGAVDLLIKLVVILVRDCAVPASMLATVVVNSYMDVNRKVARYPGS